MPRKKEKFTNKDIGAQITPKLNHDVLERVWLSSPDIIISALRSAPKSLRAKAEEFLTLLFMPEMRGRTFSSLAWRAGLDCVEVAELIRSYRLMEALLEASIHIQPIIMGTAEDASPNMDVCPKCDGIGKLLPKKEGDDERICPKCSGQGKVRVSGDTDSKKLIFETLGLTGNKGPLVEIDQRSLTVNSNKGQTLEELVGMTQGLLEAKKENVN